MYLPSLCIKPDIAERTCIHAHLASDTLIRIDNNSILLVPEYSAYRTDLHAAGLFALHAHHRHADGCLLIGHYADVGKSWIECSIVPERADQFAGSAS